MGQEEGVETCTRIAVVKPSISIHTEKKASISSENEAVMDLCRKCRDCAFGFTGLFVKRSFSYCFHISSDFIVKLSVTHLSFLNTCEMLYICLVFIVIL